MHKREDTEARTVQSGLFIDNRRIAQRPGVNGNHASATGWLCTPRNHLAVIAQCHRCNHLSGVQGSNLRWCSARDAGHPDTFSAIEYLAGWQQNGRRCSIADKSLGRNDLRVVAHNGNKIQHIALHVDHILFIR